MSFVDVIWFNLQHSPRIFLGVYSTLTYPDSQMILSIVVEGKDFGGCWINISISRTIHRAHQRLRIWTIICSYQLDACFHVYYVL